MKTSSRIVRLVDKYIGLIIIVLLYFYNLLKKGPPQIHLKNPPQKILLIKLPGIGNLVMLLPLLKKIRERFSKARIFFLTLISNQGILEGSPYIDKIFFLELKTPFRFIENCLKTILTLRREKIDLCLDFEQFAKVSSLISFLSGIPRRVGFKTRGQGRDLLCSIKVPYDNSIHTVEAFASIIKAIGIMDIDLRSVPFFVSEEDTKIVNQIFSDFDITKDDLLIGIHPGSGDNFPERRWPKENFARLADILIRNFKAKVVFTGGKGEINLVREIISLMESPAIDTSGSLNIRQLAFLIKNCSLFFSNDTAPVHIASSMGTPLVGFYGPNTPLLYGPRGKNNLIFYHKLPCSPCITNFNQKYSNCRNPVCIKSITVEEVMGKLLFKDRDLFFRNKIERL